MISKIDRGLSHFKRPIDTLDCCVGSGQAMSYPLLFPPSGPQGGGEKGPKGNISGWPYSLSGTYWPLWRSHATFSQRS